MRKFIFSTLILCTILLPTSWVAPMESSYSDFSTLISSSRIPFEQIFTNNQAEIPDKTKQKISFLQAIPSVAKQFLGIPYRYGQNPQISGATDNSYLFFSIYTLAAQQAGLTYKGYMPMKYLFRNVTPVSEDSVRNGDLMVLSNNLAAMVYQTEPWGKLYLIYASKKRQQVISFTSDNIVFKVYWMANFKGFYRIQDGLLQK